MEKLDIFKCPVCGNMVELIHVGGGPLNCCGQSMSHLTENTEDAALEKHVPVIEETESGSKVSVGSVAHPMEAAHFIKWVQIITKDNKSFRKFLSPGESPEAAFCIKPDNIKKTREFCNLHGLWSK